MKAQGASGGGASGAPPTWWGGLGTMIGKRTAKYNVASSKIVRSVKYLVPNLKKRDY